MNLNIFATATEQDIAIIEYITQIINQLLQTQENVTIALSGGTSPISLLKKLSTVNLPWKKITLTLVDDRVVPITDPDSNENLVRTHLIKHKAKKARFVGLVNQNSDQSVGLNERTCAKIDLAILGIGEDGHTASIFPDCPEIFAALDINNPNHYIITNPKSAKYQRISLTLSSLVQIPHLILRINGELKLKIIKEAILGNNQNYPISYVLTKRPDLKIYWHE